MTQLEQQPLALKPNLPKLILCFFGGLLFTAAGIIALIVLQDFKMKIVGGIAAIFFGAGTVMVLQKIIFRRPTLIIDEKGIFPMFLQKDSQKLIEWADIEKISKFEQAIPSFRKGFFSKQAKSEFLGIYLKNPEKYRFNKLLGRPEVESVVNAIGVRTSGSLPDLPVMAELLPFKIEKVLNLLKAYPVKIGEKKP